MAPAYGIWVPRCEGHQAFTSKMGAIHYADYHDRPQRRERELSIFHTVSLDQGRETAAEARGIFLVHFRDEAVCGATIKMGIRIASSVDVPRRGCHCLASVLNLKFGGLQIELDDSGLSGFWGDALRRERRNR